MGIVNEIRHFHNVLQSMRRTASVYEKPVGTLKKERTIRSNT